MFDAVGRCDEAERRRDHFVAGPDSQCFQYQMQACGSGADGDAFTSSDAFCEKALETFGGWSETQSAASQHFGHGADVGVANGGSAEWNDVVVHGVQHPAGFNEV